VALPELVPGIVLRCVGWGGAKAASGEEKRTDLVACFLLWVVFEEDQADGCLVLAEEGAEGGGRLGLLKEDDGSVACWLSPMPVPSVFFPFPISIGSSGMDDSGT